MVQKGGMSRGPYPPSQEIPMEVFDPSPQVRGGVGLEGKGPASAELGVGSGSPGKERVICPAWVKEGGVCATPYSQGLMIDGLLVRAGLRSCGEERGWVGCLSVLPPGLPRVQRSLLLGYRLQRADSGVAGGGRGKSRP